MEKYQIFLAGKPKPSDFLENPKHPLILYIMYARTQGTAGYVYKCKQKYKKHNRENHIQKCLFLVKRFCSFVASKSLERTGYIVRGRAVRSSARTTCVT